MVHRENALIDHVPGTLFSLLLLLEAVSVGFIPMCFLRMVDMLSFNSCRPAESFFSRAKCYKTGVRTEGGTGKMDSHQVGVVVRPAPLYFIFNRIDWIPCSNVSLCIRFSTVLSHSVLTLHSVAWYYIIHVVVRDSCISLQHSQGFVRIW